LQLGGSSFGDPAEGPNPEGKQLIDKTTGFHSYSCEGAYPPMRPKFQMSSSEALVWDKVWGARQAKSLDMNDWTEDITMTSNAEL